MYTCDKCHRTYRTQNSLTRHAHSHQSDNKHQCVTCGVVFYRKDLLTRHSKLHQNVSDSSVRLSISDDTFDARLRRQRCHTACDRCREIRTKCNGRNPCNSCSKAALTCHYSHRSNRLSRPPRGTGIRTSSERQRQPDNADSPYRHEAPSTGAGAGRGNDSTGSGWITQPKPDLEQNYRLDMDCSLPQDPPPVEDSTYLNVYDDSLDNTLTWPWLHEDLFLSANPSILAMPLQAMDSQAFGSVGHVMPGIDSSTIATLLPVDSLGVQSNGSANLCRAPDSVVAENDTQPDSSMPNHFDDGVAVLYTSSGSLESMSDTANSITPTVIAAPSKLDQGRIVQDLVAFAAASVSGTNPNNARASFWQATSTKVAHAFNLQSEERSSTKPALYHFCHQYLEHFAPLWPLLGCHSLDFDALHPALFLVLTSIGAMYCGSQASNYGAMMHTQIRGMLTTAIELEDDEHDFVWLAQARLLTQVAALYFGQPKAFTYAHHLGALLVAQARRNNLFSSVHTAKTLQKFHRSKGIVSDEERFGLWLQLETRRRLAFGIFRGDTYTSALLHTKPLVSMEEIDLCLPTCDAVWRSGKLSASVCLQMIEHDQTPSRELWASDIFRIAMDSKESLPPLSPAGQELLMFGLQYPIWRFSKDREMFARLTGDRKEAFSCDPSLAAPETTAILSFDKTLQSKKESQAGFNVAVDSEAHYLESAVRQMEDLQQERERLLSALAKWERGLPLVKTFVRTNLDRSSLMSSLILFHLGFIRLLVPLEELHQIQYRMADNKEIDSSLVRTVHDWAKSHHGRIAAERACNIWNIIEKESGVEKSKRVRFNLLAFIGLHHSAVLLWAYAAAQDCTNSSRPLLTLRSNSPVPVDTSHSATLLLCFVDLYAKVSPAQWSSFAKATSVLSNRPFPQARYD
ncbi:C2H2 type zinc finger domain protein [Stagonosporopsis vannaccii]|nr:C2H2 type zinc finger domain protein [Stagonosporopsis vannaccii]